MPSYYEINVAFYNRHFFATAPRSIRDRDELDRVLPVFKEKFPESEGYSITVTYWNCTGKDINIQD